MKCILCVLQVTMGQLQLMKMKKISDTVEMPDDADVSKPSEIPKRIPPMSEKNNIKIEVGLPDGIQPLFNGFIKFRILHHLECYQFWIRASNLKEQA